ncbi:hypothetical protein [uncultured Flavobacterium sp.]|tara:strand:+ start:39397 stop:39537 length:141 start_codon:yes stop_codon:yes gene_type:complete
MKKILLALLILIAIAMIIIGISAKMLPPALTGIGFIIITFLFFQKE